MELTIEQALEQGVTAHREGKVQEAERLYIAILQSQPAHPDANHNLRVITVSVNKANSWLIVMMRKDIKSSNHVAILQGLKPLSID